MDIIENRDDWVEGFKKNWLAKYKNSGEIDWNIYSFAKNKSAPFGKGIDLKQSRLVFISSAGGYLRDKQKPFDAGDDLGDYSIRAFPLRTDFSDLDYAHNHYDHTALNSDPQVLMPFGHLKELQEQGEIKALADSVISFMGYQPDITRVMDETIPQIIRVVEEEKIDAAFLVPS